MIHNQFTTNAYRLSYGKNLIGKENRHLHDTISDVACHSFYKLLTCWLHPFIIIIQFEHMSTTQLKLICFITTN